MTSMEPGDPDVEPGDPDVVYCCLAPELNDFFGIHLRVLAPSGETFVRPRFLTEEETLCGKSLLGGVDQLAEPVTREGVVLHAHGDNLCRRCAINWDRTLDHGGGNLR